MMHWTRLC